MKCEHETGPWPSGEQWPACLKCEITSLLNSNHEMMSQCAQASQEIERLRAAIQMWDKGCVCGCTACEELYTLSRSLPIAAESTT